MIARLRAVRPNGIALAALAGALAVGAVASLDPAIAVLASVVACAVVLAFVYAARLPLAFLNALGLLLVAYMAVGRGAAYIGHYPVFIGEIVLAFGVAAMLIGGRPRLAMQSPIAWLLIAFGVCGAAQTFPYVREYGTDSLRDGVAWGYAVYALLVAWALAWTDRTAEVPSRYVTLARAIPVLVPLAWFVERYGHGALPTMPGSDALLVSFKPGDAAVHLVGAMAFTLLRLPAATPEQRPWRTSEWAWWACWFVGFAIVAAYSRGGLLAMLVAGGLLVALRPQVSVWRPAALAVVLTALFAVSEISVEVRAGRRLSAEQVVSNIASITGGREGSSDLEGSREWRIRWWTTIVDYTVHGPYFWTGKGFGINLADADGFQPDMTAHTLRSPHNGHLTILARSGVPGLVLWAALQLSFAGALLGRYLRLRYTAGDWWARTYLWILAYWAAFVVNGAFDVFLEGPQGGIWFWSIFGFGLAALATGPRYAVATPRVATPRGATR